MPDPLDLASEREELERDRAIAAARARPQHDLAETICHGCSYATRAAWGRSCDGWADCLQDYERRRRGQGLPG